MAEIIENTEQNTETQTPDNLLIYPVAASDTSEETSDTSEEKNAAEETVPDEEVVTKTPSSDAKVTSEASVAETSPVMTQTTEKSEGSLSTEETTQNSEVLSVQDPGAEEKTAESSDTPAAESKSSESSPHPATENKSSESSKNSAENAANTAAEDMDDDDYYNQTSSNTTKNDHPFRDFFSNFHSKRKMELNRDEMILSRISDEDLMEYLRLEQQRLEVLQHAKDVREKRIWIAFQVAISLLSVVLIVYFLKDNPVILVTILYTIGILVALRISKRPSDSGSHKNSSDDTAKKPWE